MGKEEVMADTVMDSGSAHVLQERRRSQDLSESQNSKGMGGVTEHFNSEEGSSVSTKENSLHRIDIFLTKCFEKDITIEAFVASALLSHNDLADIFESGMAKAACFSEHGDIHAVLHVITRWCVHLHTESQKQLTNWCKRHGLRETKLKEIDQCLRRIHQTTISANEIPKMKFHEDAAFVHDQMTGIMAKLWHDHLCVYRGHKGLGYCHIASKTAVQIGKNSVSRLAKVPSTFVLCFNGTNKSPGKVGTNLCISVTRETVESVLSEYYGTTIDEILTRFCLVPITVKNIGFELGLLASSTSVRDQIKLTCDETTELFYDWHRKEFTIMCQKTNTSLVSSEFKKILERLRTELASRIIEVPYPHLHSPLRLLIGEGLKCYGVSGFRLNFHKDISNSYYKFFVDSSPSIETDHFELCETDSYQCEHRESAENGTDHYHINEQLLVTNATQRTKPTTPRARNHLKCNEGVIFRNAANASKNKKNSDAKYLKRQDDVKSGFFNLDMNWSRPNPNHQQNNEACAKNFKDQNKVVMQTDLDSCVSNVGVHCISKSSSLGCENPEIISDDLKTIRILCHEDLFARVENLLIANLGKLKRNNTIVSYKIDHISSHKEIHIQMIVANRYQVPIIQEYLQDVIRPTAVVVTKDQIQYLRGTEGQQFLNFLMDFTDTYIHFPEYQRRLYIYGESSRQQKSRSMLKRQLTSNPTENIKWQMVDLGKTVYSSVSVKSWYRKMYSYINELKCRGLVAEYILLEDRPEFWVEATPDNFQNLMNKMDSSLRGNFENHVDVTSSLVERSICFQQLDQTSDDCCLLSVCGHAYCKECLEQLVIVAARNHQVPINCAFSGCNQKLSASEFHFLCGILSSVNSKKLLRYLLMEFVANNSPAIRTCGNARCVGVGFAYEEEAMETCLWCHGRFCVRCSRNFHGEISCERSFIVNNWMMECPDNRKQCPSCRIAVEKVEGCSRVYCVWCKTYFCWKCASFSSKKRSEFISHTSDRCRLMASRNLRGIL